MVVGCVGCYAILVFEVLVVYLFLHGDGLGVLFLWELLITYIILGYCNVGSLFVEFRLSGCLRFV